MPSESLGIGQITIVMVYQIYLDIISQLHIRENLNIPETYVESVIVGKI